ncbi:hypothetical protein SERLA73DRAFT_115156 [Serpula lacrymans var. lacrymans S7.3]|uniref:Protein ZIP4 homolog n=1 Tax=Serpula lacrymans var. lacrymans (strain S7.3) TaxID=936435 RepID=F8QC77_SERL3|nr:hypothetical protein SERLA73DRAFT_115156 [Serpula lacrymans var. lacrymans S7.3]
MEAAWREKNDGLATFMADKITGYLRACFLTDHKREMLASKLLEIGKSFLRNSYQSSTGVRDIAVKALDAVRWMQKAFSVVEPMDSSATAGIAELKVSDVNARGYFLSSSQDSENLNRAEAALEEVISSIDGSVDHASSEFQQLRWMRLAIVKRRKAGETAVLQALQSIIDNMSFSETNLTEFIWLSSPKLSGKYHSSVLVTTAIQHCVHRALEHPDGSGVQFIDRLLLSLIFHCSKDEDHKRAMADLIWQYGDRHYHAGRWSVAADWFLCGTHSIFKSLGSVSSSKCLRKTALCYLQCKEYARAATIIRRCHSNEATTHYVKLLISVHQAIKCVHEMVAAPGFDRKMLLLATQLSRDSDMKALLLSVLNALLSTLKYRENVDTVTEAMTLIRCIIRLILQLLGQPGANKRLLVQTLLEHFTNAKTWVASASAENSALVIKDISWLWRTAYNCAIQGCSDWQEDEEQIPEMFDVSRQLLGLFTANSLVEVDANTHMYTINASFAAIAGRVIFTRQRAAESLIQPEHLRALATEIKSCKQRIINIMGKIQLPADDSTRAQSFLHVLGVFEVEILCGLQDWISVSHIIEEAAQHDAPVLETFEAIADILWGDKSCPVNVLFTALEAILHACLDHRCLSVEKFSRWLRSICTVLLSRNTASDRTKAIGYMEQAVAVLDEHGDLHDDSGDLYPMDERQWLLSTSYNTGIECLQFDIYNIRMTSVLMDCFL